MPLNWNTEGRELTPESEEDDAIDNNESISCDAAISVDSPNLPIEMTHHTLDIMENDSMYLHDAQQVTSDNLGSPPIVRSSSPPDTQSAAIESSATTTSTDLLSEQVCTVFAGFRLIS